MFVPPATFGAVRSGRDYHALTEEIRRRVRWKYTRRIRLRLAPLSRDEVFR